MLYLCRKSARLTLQPHVLLIDPFPPGLIAALSALNVQLSYEPDIKPEAVPAQLAGADVLVLNSKVPVTSELARQAPRLRLVIRAGVGMDHIDAAGLAAMGIRAECTPGANADAVAEHTLGMLLMLRHHLQRADREVRRFEWRREANRGREIGGKTIGIIGYGHTGSAVARRLAGFGCRILACDKYKTGFGTPQVEEVSLEKIFREAEILSLHIPLTGDTRNWVDTDFFDAFAKPLTLLNLSRGPIVSLPALLRALDEGRVEAAALDVLPNEKLHSLSPSERSLYENLFARDNVVFSPHIGGWTFESRENISAAIVAMVREFVEHEFSV